MPQGDFKKSCGGGKCRKGSETKCDELQSGRELNDAIQRKSDGSPQREMLRDPKKRLKGYIPAGAGNGHREYIID
jgi:hypothetical protein